MLKKGSSILIVLAFIFLAVAPTYAASYSLFCQSAIFQFVDDVENDLCRVRVTTIANGVSSVDRLKMVVAIYKDGDYWYSYIVENENRCTLEDEITLPYDGNVKYEVKTHHYAYNTVLFMEDNEIGYSYDSYGK